MNRRSLLAGTVGLLPASVWAQATPDVEAEPPAGVLLRQYLVAVWVKRNPNAIADFFDPEIFNLLDVQRDHVIAIDGVAEEDRPLRIRALTSDATNAMAYCELTLADGEQMDMFIVIRRTDEGLIGYYRWMAQPAIG